MSKQLLFSMLIGGGLILNLSWAINIKPVKAHIPPPVRIKTRINGPYIEAVAKRAKWGKKADPSGRYYYNYVVNKKIKKSNLQDVRIGVVRIKGKRIENVDVKNMTYYKNLNIKTRGPDLKIVSKLAKEKQQKLNLGVTELEGKEIRGKKIKVYNYFENLRISN